MGRYLLNIIFFFWGLAAAAAALPLGLF